MDCGPTALALGCAAGVKTLYRLGRGGQKMPCWSSARHGLMAKDALGTTFARPGRAVPSPRSGILSAISGRSS